MSVSDIKAFVQLAPDLGTSGQPTREQFAAIAADGYDAVINLCAADLRPTRSPMKARS